MKLPTAAEDPKRWALFGGGAMVIAIIGVVAFIALAHSPSSGTAQSQSVVCSPQPCLDLQDPAVDASKNLSPSAQDALWCTCWSRTDFSNGLVP